MCAYVVHHVDVCFLDEEYDLLLVRVHVEPCQFSQIARVNPRCHAMISRWLARRIYHWNSLIISRDTSSINSRRIEDSIFHFLDDSVRSRIVHVFEVVDDVRRMPLSFQATCRQISKNPWGRSSNFEASRFCGRFNINLRYWLKILKKEGRERKRNFARLSF